MCKILILASYNQNSVLFGEKGTELSPVYEDILNDFQLFLRNETNKVIIQTQSKEKNANMEMDVETLRKKRGRSHDR